MYKASANMETKQFLSNNYVIAKFYFS